VAAVRDGLTGLAGTEDEAERRSLSKQEHQLAKWRRREHFVRAHGHLRRILQIVFGFVPLTWTGAAVAGLSYWVYSAYGQERADYVLYAAGLVGLAVTAASLAFVLLAAFVVWLTLLWRRDDERLEKSIDVGEEVYTGFSASAMTFWPFVELDWSWQEPASVLLSKRRRGLRRLELIRATERGRFHALKRRFTIRDIFGLSAFSFEMSYPCMLRFAPVRTTLDVAIAVRESGGDGYSHPAGKLEGEYIEMRGYQPGDPLRFVLWKTFARTRRLLVRVQERAITPHPSTVAFMVAGRGDEGTASAARTMMEDGMLGREVVFSADGSRSVVRRLDEAVEQLIDSVRARGQGGKGLARLAGQVDEVQLGNCVLFVPNRFGPWFEEVRAFAARLPAPPTLIVSVDGELEQKGKWRIAHLLREQPHRIDELRAVPKLFDALSTLGSVQVVHASSGRLIDVGDIEALRQL
jgi:hypothetical protein